ncbi:MAG: Ig-like domain-containing protein [Gemmatimonadaceae bacterium]|nr:Ig-like domain-containing protein [Gemmatimonadaceae bacterium]
MQTFLRTIRQAPALAVLLSLQLITVTACSERPVDPVVEPPPARVASLEVTPTSVALESGARATLSAEARDSAGNRLTAVTIEWRSDAPAIASVSATGEVLAISPGAARITASVNSINGPVSVLVPVTVTSASPGISQWRASRSTVSDVTFLGIWDDGAGSTYAVGQNGGLLRSRNDGPWEAVRLDTEETLVSVWGASPTDIWLVGSGGLVMRGNGLQFTRVNAGVSGTLLDVWGLSANEVYMSGDRGTVVRWNGVRFETLPTGVTDELWGLWGSNSTTIFAVGNNGTLLRYDGVNWNRLTSPDATPYFDVWGTSAGNVMAIGVSGTVVRFDGVQWTRMTTPSAVNLFAIRGRSFDDVYATGNNGATWHFDGSTWRALSIGNGQNLRAMTVRGDGTVRMAGWYGTVVSLRGRGQSAQTTIDNMDPPLLGVWSAPSGPMFAVGFGGTIFRRAASGASWSQEAAPSVNDLYAIGGNSATDIVAVGDTGAILRFNGSNWQRDERPTQLVLRGIWSGGGQHVIVGERGTILRSSGPAWAPQASGTQRFLRSVWGSDLTNIFAVGDSGTVLRFDGGRWTPMSVPTPSRLRAVWGISANYVLAVGDTGTALRYDGTTWRALTAPTRRDLRAIWGRSATEIYVAGDSGAMFRYDGTNWRTITTPWRHIVYGLFALPGNTGVAAVGDGGRIFEGTP